MKRIFILVALVILSSCTTETTSEYPILKYVPQNASLILKINDFEGFKSDLKNNELLKSFKEPAFKKDITSHVSYLENLMPNSASFLCFNEVGKDKIEYTFITKHHEDLISIDSTSKASFEKIPYNGNTIIKTTIKDKSSYSFVTDSIFVNSSSQLLIENCIRSHKKAVIPEAFKKVYTAADERKTINSFLHPKHFTTLMHHMFPNARKVTTIENFSDYLTADIDVIQDEIKLNGIATFDDSLSHHLSKFKNTIPKENKIAHVVPSFFDSYTSITFDNFAAFHPKNTEIPLDALEEAGSFTYRHNTYLALRFISDTNEGIDFFKQGKVLSISRDVTIYESENTALFKDLFSPFISLDELTYYAILDEYIIFVKQRNLRDLAMLISLYKDKQTLAYQDNYIAALTSLSDESSLLFFTNNKEYKNTLGFLAGQSYKREIETINVDDYPFAALQFSVEKGKDYAHLHGILKRNKTKAKQNSVSQILNIVLDDDVANTPQFVTNHITKKKEIAVQDASNTLYLISTKGKVLWKKQLADKIIGKIHQVDLYRNGRLQLAFTTPKAFYILDRNGKEVKPFPIKAKNEFTQAVAVFDYDKNKNYRFLCVEGSLLSMYDKKKKIVSGFKFKKTNSDIINSPQHFRVRTKDYLTVQETNGTLHILDRTGKSRIAVKEKIDFSGDKVYVYNNNFTTADNKGNLIQINNKGVASKEKISAGEKFSIATTSKTLAALEENKLSIKGKTVSLDYGSYTKPKIHIVNNKIYVTTTELDTKKVSVFDSNAKLLPNFPIYGSSEIDLADFDKDKHVELVVKGDKNTIIVYKIH